MEILTNRADIIISSPMKIQGRNGSKGTSRKKSKRTKKEVFLLY